MKNILGLDLGTNSIGWSVLAADNEQLPNTIVKAGSRVIPMDAEMLGNYEKGITATSAAERRRYRSMRRLNERSKLRRDRLHRVLALMGFLPEHYAHALNRYGKFSTQEISLLAWKPLEDGSKCFLFRESFDEMLREFAGRNTHITDNGKKIPYDWTIYYLRKKALYAPILPEELAWILLHFNQKRGYYELRAEEEASSSKKREEYHVLKVVDAGLSEKKGKKLVYTLRLENGWEYQYSSATEIDLKDKSLELIATYKLDESGNVVDTAGTNQPKLRNPSENDWTLIMKRTESLIEGSGKTVGAFIYDTLLDAPDTKIKRKLIGTIERKYYKEELRQILEKQSAYIPQLSDTKLYEQCVTELYPTNESYRRQISGRGFIYLLIDDILFYQRPLKTKKSLISNCPLETIKGYDQSGLEQEYPIKCVAKSNPYYQEFRLWQFLNNLRIYEEKNEERKDVTSSLFKSDTDIVNLYDWLNERKRVSMKDLMKYKPFKLQFPNRNIRWNYPPEKEYPCNETRSLLLDYFKKSGMKDFYLSSEIEYRLWHILYSIEDKHVLVKALRTFASKCNEIIDKETFVNVFKQFPPFKKEYGNYSVKAIKKLLPLMRVGKYWNETSIDAATRRRIEYLLNNGEFNKDISERVRKQVKPYVKIEDFSFIPQWLASYIVYNRHSESGEVEKWNRPEDIDSYLFNFKQYSLRNPIVEQVVLETLRVVRDIWKEVGDIHEIHIEMGRDLKKTAKERETISKRNREQEEQNMRIRNLLSELADPIYQIENVKPYSPNQQELLKIYVEGAMQQNKTESDALQNTYKNLKETDAKHFPSKSDIKRYVLWLEQGYRSPYTGKVIPLAKLFTSAYEIEHIIPKAVYYDDSFDNKVICESEVNKLKDKRTGYQFICDCGGGIVPTVNGPVSIFGREQYCTFVEENYAHNKRKQARLFVTEELDGFIERQMNDTRYISKLIRNLLSNIVREEGEQEAVSKNVLSINGRITSLAKKDWGINDVWNRIVLPRFERMEQIENGTKFTTRTENGHLIPIIPSKYMNGFDKKRIDHRHHAMDAIVIAAVNRNMINYLNHISGNEEFVREDLRRILFEKGVLKKPWPTFTQDVYRVLSDTTVSIKQNLRVLTKSTNTITKLIEGKKTGVKQNQVLVVRKALHKESVYGLLNVRLKKEFSLDKAIDRAESICDKNLKKIILSLQEKGYDKKMIKKQLSTIENGKYRNCKKVWVSYLSADEGEQYSTISKPLDKYFSKDIIKKKVYDTTVKNILLQHLERYNDISEAAFSPEGVADLNSRIIEYNEGKFHYPIYRVRIYERADKIFPVGSDSGKSKKYVEAAKGTNLYFGVYGDSNKRIYRTIPLREVIERLKQGLSPVPDQYDEKPLLFKLSPNDMVYLPTEDEQESGHIESPLSIERIYRVVSFYDNVCYFVPVNVASTIVNKVEFGALNKIELTDNKVSIKTICLPIKIDRLGNIILK